MENPSSAEEEIYDTTYPPSVTLFNLLGGDEGTNIHTLSQVTPKTTVIVTRPQGDFNNSKDCRNSREH